MIIGIEPCMTVLNLKEKSSFESKLSVLRILQNGRQWTIKSSSNGSNSIYQVR